MFWYLIFGKHCSRDSAFNLWVHTLLTRIFNDCFVLWFRTIDYIVWPKCWEQVFVLDEKLGRRKLIHPVRLHWLAVDGCGKQFFRRIVPDKFCSTHVPKVPTWEVIGCVGQSQVSQRRHHSISIDTKQDEIALIWSDLHQIEGGYFPCEGRVSPKSTPCVHAHICTSFPSIRIRDQISNSTFGALTRHQITNDWLFNSSYRFSKACCIDSVTESRCNVWIEWPIGYIVMSCCRSVIEGDFEEISTSSTWPTYKRVINTVDQLYVIVTTKNYINIHCFS